MLRMSKLTDYGTVVLAYLARHANELHSASDVAVHTGLAQPTVSKLLKRLAHTGLVKSHRGVHGGYRLARAAEQISAAEVIDALEGPVAITECATDNSRCQFEAICKVGSAWQKVNEAIRRALDDISLSELAQWTHNRVPLFDLRAGLAGQKPLSRS